MAKTICEKLRSVSDVRALRAVLLRGAGNVFMDGHDMAGFTGDANAVQDHLFQRIQFFFSSIREILAMERPVISAIDGRVSGAGLSLMLASDLVIATKRSVFNADFTHYSTIPDGGTTFFLPRKIGMARATEFLLLGQDVGADKAETWGLVNRVVENDALEAESLALAEKLASGPTRVIGATKRLIAKTFEQELNAQLSQESSAWNIVAKTFDFREAMKAYAAKGTPKFTGA
jgi:2-(1,2-epoxy-1,2-dihydrophenyl)acetyl-CoA isomerase